MCVHRESGAQRAVKVLRKSHMDDDEKRMLFNEINILKEIVRLAHQPLAWIESERAHNQFARCF
jgi:fructose/tagatose bisphosphate aldolase